MTMPFLILDQDLVYALEELARWEDCPEIKIAAELVQLGLDKALTKRECRFRLASLTERERQVLVLHARGYTRSQISEHLCITPQTLKSHLRNIRVKLGLKTVAEIQVYLKDHPLLKNQQG